jgi:hypothetical protein
MRRNRHTPQHCFSHVAACTALAALAIMARPSLFLDSCISAKASEAQDTNPTRQRDANPTRQRGPQDTSSPWWAYVPLVRPEVPRVHASEWLSNPVDAFILTKLEAIGLKPAAPAEKRALIRRATFDLTGLPPDPADTEAFVADTTPDAFARVIDRLLASPQYGEKWGRHWLDLVRYAETNGYERDGTKPFAWRYRDYVVRSFNADKPFDRFIREQLAGDTVEPASADAIIATGYYRLGIWDDEPADPLLARCDELDDFVTTTSQVFLGMTVNCARCHDHKADPISQADYYRMVAFFQDVPRYGDRSTSERHVLTDISNLSQSAEERHARSLLAEEKDSVAAQMTAVEQLAVQRMTPEDQRATEGPQRARVLKQQLRKYLTEEENQQYAALSRRRTALQDKLENSSAVALSVNNSAARPPETHILARGSPHAPGALVNPGFPHALGPADPVLPEPASDGRGSGRRQVLADWIANRDNPLTARVLANRIWQHHFGRGLVRTTNDFGKLGERPTHPELLDWLASELVEPSTLSPNQDATADSEPPWTLKRMHKLIMLSSAYQMSSHDDPDGQRLDAANDLFWHFDMRRLTAEELRDSILAVNGSLNLRMGGPSVYTEVPLAVRQTASRPDQAWGRSPPAEQARRSIYVFVKRSLIEPVLGTFDVPDPDSTCAVRFATTVPTQSLTSLNSEFFNRQAAVFADRLVREGGAHAADQFPLGLRLILGRPPRDAEVKRCVTLFDELRQQDGLSDRAAFQAVCLLMLNLNEFVYLD